jgi:hypothetical protein
VLLSLPPAGYEAHATHHPDDITPHSSGGCAAEQLPVLLARAFTTLSDGSERLIAQLVDVDRSGTISGGDAAQVSGFPASTSPDPAVVPVEVSQHLIPAGASVDQFTSRFVWVSWTYRQDGRTVYEAFRFTTSAQTEWYQEVINPDLGSTTGLSSHVTDGFGVNDDAVRLRTETPSHPTADIAFLGGMSSVDDGFIDVELYTPAPELGSTAAARSASRRSTAPAASCRSASSPPVGDG